MEEVNYDRVIEEGNSKVKQLYWDIAFGLQEVDGLKPSKYMLKLSGEHVNGKKTYKEVREEVTLYYKNNQDNHDDDNEEEADEVATSMYEILNNKSFRFDYLTFKSYHQRLFWNLDKEKYNPGVFRIYDITKGEDILDGDTVIYQSYDMIEETLKYDFDEEKEQDYINFTKDQMINRICEFTSRIWQIHPFQDGNTRTTALFIQKYLISMGFDVNNEIFKDNSLYFRNALVRANYTNYVKGIKADKKYLIMFFENLLLGKDNKLDNKDLMILKLED